MSAGYPEYGVLMSVYAAERPEWLRQAVQDMLDQTVAPSEFVIVRDGPLTRELEEVLAAFDGAHPKLFTFVSYAENKGLGFALREGMSACTAPIIARMDSDDRARPDRMELQLSRMQDCDLDMVGSQVVEFIEDPAEPVARTGLPEAHDAIVAYSKRRNPFRHPPMTFRRDRALEAGGYRSGFLYFEDWDLFNRMLARGCRAENLPDCLVAVRVSHDFYARRGGLAYLRHAWRFKVEQVRAGWFTVGDFMISFIPQALVCVMPNALRSIVYLKMLR